MRVLIFCIAVLVPGIAAAQAEPRPSDAVLDALRLDALLAQMQTEAVATGDELGAQMLPNSEQDRWADTVARLNAPERLGPAIRDRFARALDVEHAGDILNYYTSADGVRIIDLELSARAALQEPEIERTVLEDLADLEDSAPDRARLYARYISVNDLIDKNVVGAMNANVAFLTALRETLADDQALPNTGSVYDEVRRQEPDIRASTEDWVRAFVGLAYRPLDLDALSEHVAFSATAAGQELNSALFAAFDAVFEDVSAATGTALAQQLASEEL